MKNILFILTGFFLSFTVATAQQLNTGLLFTEKATYKKIGVAALPFGTGEVPGQVDLSDHMPPVGNQANQNSCVAFSTTYACLSYYHLRQMEYYTSQANPNNVLSPAYVYNQINDGENKGTYFEDAFDVLTEQGACTFASMPYDPDDWQRQPNRQQQAEAANFKIDTYRRLNLDEATISIKAELINKHPVIIATLFDPSYYEQGYAINSNRPYIWRSYTPSQMPMGHAILIVGYNDRLNAFKFLNSWGSEWGNDGYGWIHYDIVDRVIREAYTIKPNLNTTPDLESPEIITNIENDLTPEDIQTYGLNFQILNVLHENTQNNPYLDPRTAKMTIVGSVSLPANIGHSARIVINVYFANQYGGKGQAVFSLNRQYALINGQAATGTPILALKKGQALQTQWQSFLPYSVLKVLRGRMVASPYGPRYQPHRSYLLAEPVLFIDGYPIRIGNLIPFTVDI